jgi:hypothetical protein
VVYVRIERKIEINASQKGIFDILDNVDYMPIWNLAINSVKKIDEGRYLINSTVGETSSTRMETVPNERISTKQEGGPMSGVGYLLKPKENSVEVTIWAEFENVKLKKAMGKAGEIFIESLKKFAEYLEDGGNPDEYDKKK